MSSIFILWYDDLIDGKVIRGIYSNYEKAEAYLNEMLAEEFEGEAMYSPEDFSIFIYHMKTSSSSLISLMVPGTIQYEISASSNRLPRYCVKQYSRVPRSS